MQRYPQAHLGSRVGSSLSEYGLVIALVAVVVIAGLSLLGGNLSNLLAGNGRTLLDPAVRASANADRTMRVGNSGESRGRGSGINGIIPPPASNQSQVCTSSGFCLNVPRTEARTITNTSGGLGAEQTRAMANVFRQIADQLQQDPDADPALVGLISTLANNGHAIADRQDKAISGCQPGGMLCSPYYIQGEIQTPEVLLGKVGLATRDFNSTYGRLDQYLSRHPEQLPAELHEVIRFEVNQINTISESFTANPVERDAEGRQYWNVKTATLTHQSANTICGTGGNDCYQN